MTVPATGQFIPEYVIDTSKTFSAETFPPSCENVPLTSHPSTSAPLKLMLALLPDGTNVSCHRFPGPTQPPMLPISLPDKADTAPLNGAFGTMEKLLPLAMLPVIDVAEFTFPCTVSLDDPPPLADVPYAVAVPEKAHVPVMDGIATVSPGAGWDVVV